MKEYIVWIDSNRRIVSFHKEAGFEQRTFASLEQVKDFLLELIDGSFLIQ